MHKLQRNSIPFLQHWSTKFCTHMYQETISNCYSAYICWCFTGKGNLFTQARQLDVAVDSFYGSVLSSFSFNLNDCIGFRYHVAIPGHCHGCQQVVSWKATKWKESRLHKLMWTRSTTQWNIWMLRTLGQMCGSLQITHAVACSEFVTLDEHSFWINSS